jgi:hypothetical protein
MSLYHEAKTIFLEFCKAKLQITDILTSDMDCAHRLGYVEDAKQVLLVKFFARDTVDYIMRQKTKLKGTNIQIYGDTTQKNRTLLHDLYVHPEIESSWSQSGKIWGKLKTGKKMKFGICDDISKKIISSRNKKPRTRQKFNRSSLTTHPTTNLPITEEQPVETEETDPDITTAKKTD